MERVHGILEENFEKVGEITAILLEKEILEGAEFNKLLGFPEKDENGENGHDAETDATAKSDGADSAVSEEPAES
jgi:hypothetical protein